MRSYLLAAMMQAALLQTAWVLPLCGGDVASGPWNWELAADRVKGLNNFERAQIERACKLYRAQDYRAAAGEFEKYRVQSVDSASADMLGYANLMQGLSLLAAKDRNAAVRQFEDVLTYTPEDISDAGAALYYKGRAHIDSGDLRKGLEAFQQMADNADYRYHALAAGAIRELADNMSRTGKDAQAITLYRQVAVDFAAANPEEARVSRWNLAIRALRDKQIDAYVAWLAEHAKPGEADKPQWRVWLFDEIRQASWHAFAPDGRFMSDAQARNQSLAVFAAWLPQQKPWYDKAGQTWAYCDHVFSVYRMVGGWTKESLTQMIDLTMSIAKSNLEAAKGNDGARANALNQFAWLVDRLMEFNQDDRALAVADLIPFPPMANLKAFHVLRHQGKREGLIGRLEAVEKDPAAVGYWAKQATTEKAMFYKDYLNDYEKAIKALDDLDNPPWNLWQKAECYRRWGKNAECNKVLVDIEGSFPDDAARAAMARARYLLTDGDKKAAISVLMHIVKQYKTSPECGQAHDILKQENVDGGGGDNGND